VGRREKGDAAELACALVAGWTDHQCWIVLLAGAEAGYSWVGPGQRQPSSGSIQYNIHVVFCFSPAQIQMKSLIIGASESSKNCLFDFVSLFSLSPGVLSLARLHVVNIYSI